MKLIFRKTTALLLALGLSASLLPASQKVQAVQYTGTASYMSGKYYQKLRQVALTGDARTDIVSIARSQIGYQEGGSLNQLSGQVHGGVNHTEFGEWYGMQDQWCAMFLSWCASLAGASEEAFPKHCFTPEGLQWFAVRGRAYSREEVATSKYVPQPGDLIYFKSTKSARTTNHVGLVTGYSRGRVHTIEGNVAAAGVMTSGGAVVTKSYPITNTYIVYICSPDYEVVGTNVQTPKTTNCKALREALIMQETGGALGYGTLGDRGTLGIGQWYGEEALDLLRRIRRFDEAAFAALDTAGVGEQLDENRLPADPAGLTCLSNILASRAGVCVQEQKLEETLSGFLSAAEDRGVTDSRGQLLCAAVGYLAGNGTVNRVLTQAGEDLSSASLFAALEAVNPDLFKICRSLQL